MIRVTCKGNYEKTKRFFRRATNGALIQKLNKYGEEGVLALSKNTPVDTGRTAASWQYQVVKSKSSYQIHWSNTNVNHGVNIALILQMGHGTRNGGYVKGVDYINPAMRPVFDRIADEAWKEVTLQ
jgi:hypothetical protein|nr:MAG TPA: type I neck protein [Caudoviricetes sp.]